MFMGTMKFLPGRWKLVALLLSLLLLALLLATFKTRLAWSPFFLEDLVVSVVMPLQKVVEDVALSLDDIWHDYINLIQVRHENLRLRQQVEELQGQLHRYQEAYLQQQRLQKLLSFHPLEFPQPIVAEVVGIDPSQWSEAVTINKGRHHRIRKDSAVVTHQGLVGRILETTANHSIVLLVTDRRSVVDALVQRTRARGIVVGKSRRLCELRYVDFHADVQVGDTIISSGLGEVYPKGLRIGVVVSVRQKPHGLFHEVEVQPAVDLAKLEEVLVLVP